MKNPEEINQAREKGKKEMKETEEKVLKEKERWILIHKCLERFFRLAITEEDWINNFLDIEYSRVNVWNLVKSSDIDLVHDIVGIIRHMDRNTKKLKDFVPRAGIIKEK